MPRPPIESFEELRVALAAAVPPQHRARVVAIGRMLLSSFETLPPADRDARFRRSPSGDFGDHDAAVSVIAML